MLRPWPVELTDRIGATPGLPVHAQITQAIIRDIEGGRLTSGTYLPSTRALAATLGVNRKTVVCAYEDLIAQGWLTPSATRGTMVSSALPAPAAVDRQAVRYPFAAPPSRALALPEGRGLKLDEGSPDGRLFPADLLARTYRAAAQRVARANRLQYRDPRGTLALREGIAAMLRGQRGLNVTADHILLTRGSQNGIFLATQLLVQPGDAVVVEELTYEPAVAALRQRGATVIPVPLDDDGIDVGAVEEACRARSIRAIFLTPHHQFPTTVALRPERRLRLLDLARMHGFAIIEDDYDHEFHFGAQPLLPMAAIAPEHVIYVGSLSKLLIPALRIGFVAAPVPVVAALAHLVSLVDGMGNSLTEEAVAELIVSGELRRHTRRVREVYADRRLRFAEILAHALGDRVEVRLPDGGLAFWLRFGGDIERLERRAAGAGLHFAASGSFKARADAPTGLRFGFASLTPDEAERALQTLAAAARA